MATARVQEGIQYAEVIRPGRAVFFFKFIFN